MFFKTFFIRYIAYFFIGLAVLLVVEVGAMIYVNNFYLADNSNYSEVKIVNSAPPEIKYKNVAVDSDAKNIESSHDGRYVAYLLDGSIKIADLVSGQTSTVGSVDSMTVSGFQWLYDRDWLAIAQAGGTSSSPYIKMYSYDTTEKKLTEIRNNNNNSDLKIRLTSKTNTVSAIDMSTETGVTYVKITDKNNKSKLWKINSFVGVSQMGSTRTKNIGGIQCLKTVDDLLYEDKDNGRVYQYSKNTSFIVEGSRSLKLLGFDSSDNVYLAKMKDGKTSTVCYAGVTGSSTGSSTDSAAEISWNTVNLGKSVDPSEIHVTDSGEIYIVSTSNNYLDKVFSQNSTGSSSVSASLSASDSESSSSITGRTKYSGTLECIFDTGFITVVNGQLVHNNFAG